MATRGAQFRGEGKREVTGPVRVWKKVLAPLNSKAKSINVYRWLQTDEFSDEITKPPSCLKAVGNPAIQTIATRARAVRSDTEDVQRPRRSGPTASRGADDGEYLDTAVQRETSSRLMPVSEIDLTRAPPTSQPPKVALQVMGSGAARPSEGAVTPTAPLPSSTSPRTCHTVHSFSAGASSAVSASVTHDAVPMDTTEATAGKSATTRDAGAAPEAVLGHGKDHHVHSSVSVVSETAAGAGTNEGAGGVTPVPTPAPTSTSVPKFAFAAAKPAGTEGAKPAMKFAFKSAATADKRKRDDAG